MTRETAESSGRADEWRRPTAGADRQGRQREPTRKAEGKADVKSAGCPGSAEVQPEALLRDG